MNPNEHAFFDALRRGETDLVTSMVTETSALAHAVDDADVSAVLVACYHRQFPLAEWLADQKGAIDAFEAAALGRTGRLQELLEASPHVASACSADGFTPLHYAAFFCREPAARLLVGYGAPLDDASRNAMRVTPLGSAAASGALEVVGLLLAQGANVEAAQSGGWRPLHSAASQGNRALAEMLLAAGADRSAGSDDGITPAQLARQRGHDAMASWLAEYPAS